MDSAGRRAEFAKAVDPETAKLANTLFEKSMQTTQMKAVQDWIDKNMQKPVLKKAALARLETMKSLGLLDPASLATFMEDYVADQLGTSVTMAEAAEISRLTEDVSNAKKQIELTHDWTASNRTNVVDYWRKRKKLENYISKLDPTSNIDLFATITSSGSMLLSLRSLAMSIGYQGFPTLQQFLLKRFASGTAFPGTQSPIEKFQAAMSARFLGGRMKKVVGKGNLSMAMQIYKETGYDISRMATLDDGFSYFGEKVPHTEGLTKAEINALHPSIADLKGIQLHLNRLVRGHAKVMTWGFKYAAGGTDTFLANAHRYDTTLMLAKTRAYIEGLKDTAYEKRVQFLFRDAMRPDPQDEMGKYIHEVGISDAHYASYTNKGGASEVAVAFRDALSAKTKVLGRLQVPFLKIPAEWASQNLQMATLVGAGLGVKQIAKAMNMDEGTERQTEIAEGLHKLLMYGGGFMVSSILLGLFLDDDDYIAPYDLESRGEHELDKVEGLSSNMIRIKTPWGKTPWFSTKFLGPYGVTLSAQMQARKSYHQTGSVTRWFSGYARGVLQGLSEFPGAKETWDWGSWITKAVSGNLPDPEPKKMGLEIANWISSRTLTATATQDVFPVIGRKLGITQPKPSDAFGQQQPDRTTDGWEYARGFFAGSSIKPDRSNAMTQEFEKLAYDGKLPILTDPSTGENAKKLKATMKEDEYEKYITGLKQEYAKAVEKLINTESYQKKTPAEKKKAIDDLRTKNIIDKIEEKVEYGPTKLPAIQ
jgi:hypothetical protein